MRKLKWNVLILVVFVLIISSLIWLLALHFIQQLNTYSDNVYFYNKSYYLAQAGSELWLTEAAQRWVGFSHEVFSGDSVLKDNFDCLSCTGSCYYSCDMSMKILGKTTLLNNTFWLDDNECTSGNTITLNQWDAIILPLFYEQEIIDNYTILSSENIAWNRDLILNSYIKNNIDTLFSCVNCEWKEELVTLWLFAAQGVELYNEFFVRNVELWDMVSEFFSEFDAFFATNNWLAFDSLQHYLIIANTENDKPLSFCLQTKTKISGQKVYLPTEKFFVESVASFRNMTISLQAFYKQPIPDFLFGGWINGFWE